jgi:hypothetical protein
MVATQHLSQPVALFRSIGLARGTTTRQVGFSIEPLPKLCYEGFH